MAGYGKLFLLGDSITQEHNNWATLLGDYLRRRSDLINRGLSGYNSRWLRLLMPKLLSPFKLHDEKCAAIILLGANDSGNPERSEQSVPLNEFVSNLETMVDDLVAGGIKASAILIMGCSPPNPELCAKGHTVDGTHEYCKAAIDVAAKKATHSLDLFQVWQERFPNSFSTGLRDGLHLNQAGNQAIYDAVLPIVQKWEQEGILPQEMIIPDWKVIDLKHPERTLH
eukprot:Clim_evm103s157 gene=Clim_evmTU103s157